MHRESCDSVETFFSDSASDLALDLDSSDDASEKDNQDGFRALLASRDDRIAELEQKLQSQTAQANQRIATLEEQVQKLVTQFAEMSQPQQKAQNSPATAHPHQTSSSSLCHDSDETQQMSAVKTMTRLLQEGTQQVKERKASLSRENSSKSIGSPENTNINVLKDHTSPEKNQKNSLSIPSLQVKAQRGAMLAFRRDSFRKKNNIASSSQENTIINDLKDQTLGQTKRKSRSSHSRSSPSLVDFAKKRVSNGSQETTNINKKKNSRSTSSLRDYSKNRASIEDSQTIQMNASWQKSAKSIDLPSKVNLRRSSSAISNLTMGSVASLMKSVANLEDSNAGSSSSLVDNSKKRGSITTTMLRKPNRRRSNSCSNLMEASTNLEQSMSFETLVADMEKKKVRLGAANGQKGKDSSTALQASLRLRKTASTRLTGANRSMPVMYQRDQSSDPSVASLKSLQESPGTESMMLDESNHASYAALKSSRGSRGIALQPPQSLNAKDSMYSMAFPNSNHSSASVDSKRSKSPTRTISLAFPNSSHSSTSVDSKRIKSPTRKMSLAFKDGNDSSSSSEFKRPNRSRSNSPTRRAVVNPFASIPNPNHNSCPSLIDLESKKPKDAAPSTLSQSYSNVSWSRNPSPTPSRSRTRSRSVRRGVSRTKSMDTDCFITKSRIRRHNSGKRETRRSLSPHCSIRALTRTVQSTQAA